MCSLGSNWQNGSTGLDNGLVPNRWQAIIGTNAGMLYWHIYASFGLNELNGPPPVPRDRKYMSRYVKIYL